MAKKNKEYQKLPGYGTRFEGLRWVAGRRMISTLWLGKDHLLRIDRAGYTEEYKRFYYRDIQAFCIQRTDRRRTWNIVLMLLASLLFFAAFSIDDRSGVAMGIFGSMGAMVAIIALVNTLLGPTCDSFIKTAVQYEPLPSWNRLRTVKKALPLIKARIEEAQGVLGVEELRAGMENAPEAAGAVALGRGLATPNAATEAIKPYNSKVHLFAFLALLGDGVVTAVQIFFNSVPMLVVGMLCSFAASAFIIIALVKQYQTDLRTAVRRCTWTALGFMVIEFMLGYVQGVVFAVRNPGQYTDEWEMLRQLAEISPLETPWLLSMMLFTVVFANVIGLVGLYLLRPVLSKGPAAAAAIDPGPAQTPPLG